jgi:hypothetical protein
MAASGRALITGASSGLGAELAREFARHGHDLVLVARDAVRLNRLAEELQTGSSIALTVVTRDLAQPGAAGDLAAELSRRGLEIDILVNNAGMIVYGEFSRTSWEDEQQMIGVNLMALTQLTKLLLPGMLARREGKILNVGSVGSFAPSPLNAVYSATKAYVLSLSEALAEEVRGSGVSVMALCPGVVRTELQTRASMTHVRLMRSGVLEAADVARAGYAGLMAGRRVVVYGPATWLQVFLTRFLPRVWVVRSARRMLE